MVENSKNSQRDQSDKGDETVQKSSGANGSKDHLSSLEKRIQDLETLVKEKENKYVYLYADFENFKKRIAKEKTELLKFGWEHIAKEFLLAYDNLERALSHVDAATDKTLLTGIQLVQQQFRTAFEKWGVQLIETKNVLFDPNLHEAAGQSHSELPPQTIIGEESKGYTLHGRLLRPARVIVSLGPETQKVGVD